MNRTPKVGEVWTSETGTDYLCIVDVPDDNGCYVWNRKGKYLCWPLDWWTTERLGTPETIEPIDVMNRFQDEGVIDKVEVMFAEDAADVERPSITLDQFMAEVDVLFKEC